MFPTRIIIMFTKSNHWTPFYVNWILSTPRIIFNIHNNKVPPFTLLFSKLSLYFTYCKLLLLHIFPIVCCIFCQPNSPQSAHPKNIWLWLQIMKLLTMSFLSCRSSLSYRSRFKQFPQHPLHEYAPLMFFPYGETRKFVNQSFILGEKHEDVSHAYII